MLGAKRNELSGVCTVSSFRDHDAVDTRVSTCAQEGRELVTEGSCTCAKACQLSRVLDSHVQRQARTPDRLECNFDLSQARTWVEHE